MIEMKLNGTWNAERVLHNALQFCDDRGEFRNFDTTDDSPYGIKKRRFVAAIKAYGKEKCLKRGASSLISDNCSSDKLGELKQLVIKCLQYENQGYIERHLSDIEDLFEREDMFEMLFRYRKMLYKVEDAFSGMSECGGSVFLAIKTSKRLFEEHIKTACDSLDRMLILLMGDDYDHSFSEVELLPFGYPDKTDDELIDI